jgi:hypothetical protein
MRGEAVEAQDVAQHRPEAGAQQVAALGKHGVERVAAPFDVATPAPWGDCTENDISEGARATPSSSNIAIRPG